MRTLAVDIGGTKFTLGAFDGDHLRLRESFQTDRNGGPKALIASIEQIVTRWRSSHQFHPDRCGVGFGGPVDYASQSVVLSTHVAGWQNYPLVEALRRIAQSPVVMDNDANAGALGESRHGAGRGMPSLFYLTLSTGIGGGLVVGGEIWRGADSFGGEIGHMNIEPSGPACLCGSNGCLERMCCGLWLEQDYGQSAEKLMLDPAFVSRYVVHLARGLKAAIMMLNPHVVVIGGGIAKAGDALFIPLRQELERQMTSWSLARRHVVPALLADDSVLYGALELAKCSQ